MREPRAHTSEELLFTRGVPNARSPERPETKAVEDTLLELLRTRNEAACEIKREARGEEQTANKWSRKERRERPAE